MKIEFQSTTFKNFLTFGNKEQHLELKPGLTLITGLDHATGRSNGAGKCVEGFTMIDICIEGQAETDFLTFLRR